ncbi:MAG: CBS domain-containing protein [Gammaproteobacteria bacterium]|nr:CBS domain-containing protein [Gammaproteobacteria bacterium]MYA37660.1 CBS domain-containing protein [Gammaproteobacteria bacterium]MYA67162.1 CBS domain-containing protein [Gammaproteobacteria bacterium]MYE29498.1 CBS domain-containing protein [Gammaproteobacteria bacterium]MYE99834.1 CBS domain-containing protein [Gammaproteobacteria bacterium]
MHTMRQILDRKQNKQICSIRPDASVYDAIKLMADRRVGALLVMTGPELQGVISERDYAREVILKGRASRDTRVDEIMTVKVISVPSSHAVDAALNLMTDNHIRHLPVVDDGLVVGIVSLGDLVKDIMSDQRATIEQLQNYIRS